MTDQTKILVAATKDQAEYDEAAKNLFKNKEILAPVLKYAIEEYEDYTVEEIIGFIDGISISIDTPVDDTSVMVDASDTELASISDKLIRYDVRLKSLNPKLSTADVLVHIHIDFEVQNDYRPTNPKYPVIKRGIYYAAREISSQLGVLTEETDYDKIEKVYSIWVCNQNIPPDLVNTMDKYYIHKEHIIGNSVEPETDYDLMEVVMIRRGADTGVDAIFDYLSGVFNSDIKKISDYTDTNDNEEIAREVTHMSGLGASIAQAAAQEAAQEAAYQASIRQLIETARILNAPDAQIIRMLMDKFGFSEAVAKDYISQFELQPV